MANRDSRTKYLRIRGNQWQFRRRWHPSLRTKHGEWHIVGLGTLDLAEAGRMRDRLVVDMNDEAAAVVTTRSMSDSRRLEEYLNSKDEERDALEMAWAEEAEDRWGRFKGLTNEMFNSQMLWDPEGVGTWSPEAEAEAGSWFRRITGRETPIELHVARWNDESPVAVYFQKDEENPKE